MKVAGTLNFEAYVGDLFKNGNRKMRLPARIVPFMSFSKERTLHLSIFQIPI